MKNTLRRDSPTKMVMVRALTASIGFFFFGYQQGILNLSLKTLIQNVFFIDSSEASFFEGLFSSLQPGGAIVGCIVANKLHKHDSNYKKTFMVIDVLSFIGSFLTIITNTIPLFMVGRFISGLCVGLNTSIVPEYVNNVSPTELKAITGCLLSILVCFGIIVSNLFALGYNNQEGSEDNFWIFTFLLPSLITLIRTIIFFSFLRSDEQTLQINQKLLEADSIDNQQGISQNSNMSEWIKLLKLRRVEVGIVLQLAQQFCGINAVVFYSSKIFGLITIDETAIFCLSLSMNVALLVCSGAAGIFSSKFGRKSILFIGSGLCSIFLAIFGFILYPAGNEETSQPTTFTNIVCVLSLLGFILSYGVSLGPIVWSYNSEILTEKGLQLATLANWSGALFIIFLFPLAVSIAPLAFSFFFFSICSALAALYINTYVEETKDLTPEQISKLYKQIDWQSIDNKLEPSLVSIKSKEEMIEMQ